jgi:hypothetical protein
VPESSGYTARRLVTDRERERRMDTRESTETTDDQQPDAAADLEQRNEQLDEHIEEAEHAVDRRRSVTGEKPPDD